MSPQKHDETRGNNLPKDIRSSLPHVTEESRPARAGTATPSFFLKDRLFRRSRGHSRRGQSHFVEVVAAAVQRFLLRPMPATTSAVQQRRGRLPLQMLPPPATVAVGLVLFRLRQAWAWRWQLGDEGWLPAIALVDKDLGPQHGPELQDEPSDAAGGSAIVLGFYAYLKDREEHQGDGQNPEPLDIVVRPHEGVRDCLNELHRENVLPTIANRRRRESQKPHQSHRPRHGIIRLLHAIDIGHHDGLRQAGVKHGPHPRPSARLVRHCRLLDEPLEPQPLHARR
mmetsp:Transcript_22190/g.76137  ORF Transcript_22190/g.76137 Transcript_22190/m.76137 type:complete len:283 (+) Transcript_22190:184-1032(+)